MEHAKAPFAALSAETTEAILAAVASLRFGTVEVTVHDGRVVQLDRRERVRFAVPAGDAARPLDAHFRPTATAAASTDNHTRHEASDTHRTTGGQHREGRRSR